MITVQKGDRISEYILEEPLGKGGFGEVWRARHHLWRDREVAVKIPTRPEAVRDLSNEGLIQASLEHPGIAKSLGMDTSADPPYFIVEYVPGRSLRQLLSEAGKLPVEQVRSILEQILDVLDYAHSRGVVHQDIKPENIILSEEGDVKLTDFGLGQTVAGESILLSVSLRSEGVGPGGTIGYIAPEIRDGEGPPDGRSDLYSVGILLFELLTGRRPAGAELPSELEPGMPSWCDRVFRGLYTRRETRFADVAAVRAALVEENAGPRVSPLAPPGEAPPPAEPQLVSASEAVRILGVTPDKLRELVGSGALTPVSKHGTLHYSPAQLADVRESLGLPRTRSAPPPVPRHAGGRPAARGVSRGRSGRTRNTYGRKVSRPPVVRPVHPGVPAARRTSGGLFVRGIATGIDLWVVFIALAVIQVFLPMTLTRSFFSIFVVYLAYAWVLHGTTGRTVGKLILGLRVVTVDGRDLSAGRALVRSLGFVLSCLTFGIGFLIIPFGRRKQALHDFLADTCVVYDRGSVVGVTTDPADDSDDVDGLDDEDFATGSRPVRPDEAGV